MKKLSIVFLSVFVISLNACEGPVGPIGPQGPEGEPGVNIVGSVFEIITNLTADGNFGVLVNFQEEFNLEVLPSDAVLVYILWEEIDDSDGNPLPIWRQLPQTVFLDDGMFQYNFEHTDIDVDIFLDGPYDLNSLPDVWTIDQVFRIVVVPADFVNGNARYDFSDYHATLDLFGIDDSEVKRIEVK